MATGIEMEVFAVVKMDENAFPAEVVAPFYSEEESAAWARKDAKKRGTPVISEYAFPNGKVISQLFTGPESHGSYLVIRVSPSPPPM